MQRRIYISIISTIALLVLSAGLFAQSPKPVMTIGGAGGGGGSSAPPYSSSFSAVTTTTVTAATHGLGTTPIDGGCWDDGTPRLAIAQTAGYPQIAANGDVTWAWTGSKTGICYLFNSSASGSASGDLTGTYPGPTIAANAVTSAKILDGTIAAGDIASDAITTVKILDANVTMAKIAAVVDFTTKTSTAPMKAGTSAPGTCTVGDVFFDTDATAGQNIYGCTATHTWTLEGDGGGGGGGSGDVVGPSSSVDAEVALFDSTTGKLLKRATGTGFAYLTSGVLSVIASPIPYTSGGTGQSTATDDNVLVGSGSAWQLKAIGDCDDSGGNHLNYDTATNAFSCGTSTSGGGTLPSYTGNAHKLLKVNAGESASEWITIGSGLVCDASSCRVDTAVIPFLSSANTYSGNQVISAADFTVTGAGADVSFTGAATTKPVREATTTTTAANELFHHTTLNLLMLGNSAGTNVSPIGPAQYAVITNAGTTGTLLNGLVKLTGAPSTAVRTGTSDTTGVVGVAISGAGTTGSAIVQLSGRVSCVFSGATTAGNYVLISDATAGNCKDGGSSETSATIGQVLSTNGGAGTYEMILFPSSRSGGGGGGAPTDATYITQTANGSLSAEQALGALATGILKNTTTTGVLSIATTDDLSAPKYCADAGANDTYACNLSPAISGYTTGASYWFKANTANTGAATINFNSLGAKTIKKMTSAITTDLADNDIRSGQIVCLYYDGTNMQMCSQLGNAAAGASTSGQNLISWRVQQNEPPASNYATLDSRNSHPVLDFDADTDESAVFSGVLPAAYAGGGATVRLYYMMTSATANEVIWCGQFERNADASDMTADSFATANCTAATTVPGTAGLLDVVTINFSDGAQMDSLADNERFRLKVYRDANDAGDDATGDAELVAVQIVEQ